jgi:hypothetical protein
VREVFGASEEAHEWTALLRYVIADGALQRGILRLEGVEYRALRDLSLDFQAHLALDLRDGSKVLR